MSHQHGESALISGLDYLHAFDRQRAVLQARISSSADTLTEDTIRQHLARQATGAALEANATAAPIKAAPIKNDPIKPGTLIDELGGRLRALRKRRGLTLRGVEDSSGGRWKAVVIGSYERGDRSVSIRQLADLAEFYGVRLDELLPAPAA